MNRKAASADTTGRSRLEKLFFAALPLPAEEQESFVQAECASDPGMATSLRKLLAAERSSTNSWTPPVWTSSGLRFGPYHVTGRIGSGGMGVVYSAVRDDSEFSKKVAIKAIPPSLVTESGALALRQERQILALLEHPNIARLLDGGTTDYGVPYLVMEFVEGLPLLAYAEERGLSTAERLGLFVSVCDGVAYAHRNLVIHRDLKPSNILVTADGTPKLLDFGIARLMNKPADLTLLNARSMTPDFASPEQLMGQRMTTASDIYSLGVVLFVLLTGRPASQAKSERARLGDDLGTIVSMAMRADPAQRYNSVEQLSEDVRRYLGGHPVIAHRSTFRYQAGKFISRHRAALAATLAVLTAFAAVAVYEVRASQIAKRRYDEARKLAIAFAFEVPDTIASVPGTLAARQLIIKRATQYLDTLAREPGHDFTLDSELAAAYNRIGTITFQVDESLQLHRKALAINLRLAEAQPRNRHVIEQLSESYIRLAGILREEGDSSGALENYRLGLETIKPLASENPAGVADAYNTMGMMVGKLGRHQEAVAYNAKALAIRQSQADAAPADVEKRAALDEAEIWSARGFLQADKLSEALEMATRVSSDEEKLIAADPANGSYRRERWVAKMIAARALEKLGDTRATNEFRECLGIIQSIVELDPGDRGNRRGMAITWLGLGHSLAGQGHAAEAEQDYRHAIAESEKLLKEDPKKVETTIDLGLMYMRLGSLYLKMGNPAARPLVEKGRQFIDTAWEKDPQDDSLRGYREEVYAILNGK
jgi:serine/threonine protein kinase